MPSARIHVTVVTILLTVLPALAAAQSMRVNGQLGVLGEWELNAIVEIAATGKEEFVGPYKLKHTGMCAKDGPEEKSGEMRLRLSSAAKRIDATLLIDGVACSFSAKKAQSFSGVIKCPDRDDNPLLVWVRSQL